MDKNYWTYGGIWIIKKSFIHATGNIIYDFNSDVGPN